jgi:lipopolysaccharide transport system permease protein
MLPNKRELRLTRDLLWLLTKKEITLKYKRTFLGIFWSLLNPIILASVLFVAFTIFLRFQMENYTFFLLSALFPWNWFSASIIVASGTLIANIQLLRKVRFPRYLLVIAAVLAQLVNFLFALPVIMGLAYYYGKGPEMLWLIGIPILIVLQIMVVTGLSLLVSVLNAYFRDMEYVIGVLLTILFWMTPIIYPLDMVPWPYKAYLTLNPLTSLVTAWRDLLTSNTLDWGHIGISWINSLLFLFLGAFVFQRFGRKLDEVL